MAADIPYHYSSTIRFRRVSLRSNTSGELVNVFRTFGSSVYTPALPEIQQEFGVSKTAALLGLTLWVLGLAFGPVLAAPISETFGRLYVYRLSLPLSMLFTLGAGFSKSFGALLVCRFFGGTLGSSVLSVGSGTNADLFPARLRAYSTSSFVVAPFLGPALDKFASPNMCQRR